MRNFFRNLFSSRPGEPGTGLISPADFTREVVEAFRKARPELVVEILGEMEIKAGDRFQGFLNNAYDNYRLAPGSKDQVIQSVVATALETVDRPKEKSVDPASIVPVIKDAAWLAESLQILVQRGISDPPRPAHEIYNEELTIVYAEDSPHGLRYVSATSIEEAGVKRENLRELAIANLNRLLPDIRQHGQDGHFLFTADGNFEASLILLTERIWEKLQADVRGEIVIAVPTRDVLLVTGSAFPEGLAHLRETVARVLADNPPYRLTDKLFVYRGGKFEVFDDSFLPA